MLGELPSLRTKDNALMDGEVAGKQAKQDSRRRGGPAGAAIASLSRHVQGVECLAAAAAADQFEEEEEEEEEWRRGWCWCRSRSVVGDD